MIKKISCVLWAMVALLGIKAQPPICSENFEAANGITTVTGIAGKALNLGPDASIRKVMLTSNKWNGSEKGFSVTLWVKGEPTSQEVYTILSSLQQEADGYSGWKIGVTATGSWGFTILRNSKVCYEYTTTNPRQTTRDGNWHLLAVTYKEGELRFYYDGNNMAIYRADSIERFYAQKQLVIGGSIDSEHSFQKLGSHSYWDTYNGQIDDIAIYGHAITAEALAAYYQQVTGKKQAPAVVDHMPNIFTVTAFNIFHGAHEFGKETGKNHLVEMLRQRNADTYLLVETYGSGAEIADALGYYLYLISTNLSIISRYPFTKTYPLSHAFNGGAAQVQLSNGKKINLVSLWLNYLPGRNIGNKEGWSETTFVEEENKTRGADIRRILKDIQPLLGEKDSIPLIVGGDFNSGSHLDWTERTKSIHKGYTLPWPVSIAMNQAGFKDSFREIYPDALAMPGTTFYKQDRIDYIYYQGSGIHAIDSEIVSEHPVTFPSDHSMMSTLFRLGN
jgi:hypothetical protein